MTRFTPAPWSKDGIYLLLRFSRKSSGPWDDACEDYEYFPDEGDAALITAAPDLYEALQSIISNSTIQTNHPTECEHAEKILAKARGEW